MFFSAPHGAFSKTDHILGTKQVSRDNIEITAYILSDQHGLKLDISNNRKLANLRKLNSLLLNEKWVKAQNHRIEGGGHNICPNTESYWDLQDPGT